VRVDAPPWAKPDECTENVARVVEEHGGEASNGWRLWEPLPGLMIEAEFHMVWMSENKLPLDVTPSLFPGITETVFLADPDLSYESKQIDNVRVALTDEPLVRDLIQVLEADFEVMNRGELANHHGFITMTPEMQAIKDRQGRLFFEIAQKYY
jgi:hypothetical protein